MGPTIRGNTLRHSFSDGDRLSPSGTHGRATPTQTAMHTAQLSTAKANGAECVALDDGTVVAKQSRRCDENDDNSKLH